MHHYKHTQFGSFTVLPLVVAIVMTGAIFVGIPEGRIATAPVFAILILTLGLFHALTVEVSADEVLVIFGIGIIRRSICVTDICDARIVRNKWYYSWGIRLTPHGWLWNVSGLDAVELEFEGGRKFRIGTDDPAGLLGAIQGNAVHLKYAAH